MRRHLAAILAADVAGYSRLMGENELGTLDALRELRRELFAPAVASHRGKVVKSMGDGWLVEFSSAVDAVNCAMRVQDRLVGNDLIKLRIGVHIGDIVHEDEDIYGDGVNVASRLQDEATPGGIVISDPTYSSLDGTLTPSFDDAGQWELKNIRRPVQVWLRGPRVERAPARQDPGTSTEIHSGFPRLTNCPPTNSDERQEVRELVDALTFDLNTYLDGTEWLEVEVKDHPGAHSYVFRASLRTRKNRLRLEANFNSVVGERIWTKKYDGDLDDSFDWQDETAEDIAKNVRAHILDIEGKRISAKRVEDMTAEECLLFGIVYSFTGEFGSYEHCLRFVGHAISKDPKFGSAYAMGVGFASAAISVGRKNEIAKYLPELDTWASKAEKLLSNGTAHNSTLAVASAIKKKEPSIRHREIEQQLRKAPFDEITIFYCGAGYVFLGEPQLALECLRKSRRYGVTPWVWPTAGGLIAIAHVMLGNDEAAIEEAMRVIERMPSYVPPHKALAAACGHLGRQEEATKAIKNVLEILPEDSISGTRDRSGYIDNAAVSRFLEGLRIAGLPE